MAQGDLKVRDSDQMSASLAGIPFEGLADGEWLRIQPEGPAFTDTVGTDGEVTRSKTNDRRATAVLRLMSTSSTNALLSALHNSDKNTPGGIGVGAFLLRDRQGADVFSAEKAWISKEPDVSEDRTPTVREWTIRIASLVSFHGGN